MGSAKVSHKVIKMSPVGSADCLQVAIVHVYVCICISYVLIYSPSGVSKCPRGCLSFFSANLHKQTPSSHLSPYVFDFTGFTPREKQHHPIQHVINRVSLSDFRKTSPGLWFRIWVKPLSALLQDLFALLWSYVEHMNRIWLDVGLCIFRPTFMCAEKVLFFKAIFVYLLVVYNWLIDSFALQLVM